MKPVTPAAPASWKAGAGLGVVLALVLVALAVFVRDHLGSLYDDAFLYLRYARNLREGCGLRWNCEDTPVEGFTSPAWLLLLVLVSTFTAKLTVAAEMLAAGSLALALVAVLLFADRLAARLTDSGHRRLAIVGATALALAADHEVLINGVVGVESPLVALTVVAFAAAVFAGRAWLVVITALVAALVRPECTLLTVVLPFVPRFGRTERADERRHLWMALVLGLLLEVGIRFSLFGDLVPNIFWVHPDGGGRQLALGAASLGQELVAFPALLLAPTVLASPALRREAAPLLGAFFLWMAAFLWTGGDLASCSRFVFPLVPVCTAFSVCGVFALAERARGRVDPAIGAVAVAALLATRAELHRVPIEHGFVDVLAWTEIGARLRRVVPGAHLAAVPIGAIGLYSHEYVLDLVGFTRRDIAMSGARLSAIENEYPDVIVTSVTGPQPFLTLDDVHPQGHVDRQIVEAVRSHRLDYRPVDMEVTPGMHFLLLALGTEEGVLQYRLHDLSAGALGQ